MHSDFLGLTRVRVRVSGYCSLVAFPDYGKMSLKPIVLAPEVATNIRVSQRIEFVGCRIRGMTLRASAIDDDFHIFVGY
jgi:hypothetical protein